MKRLRFQVTDFEISLIHAFDISLILRELCFAKFQCVYGAKVLVLLKLLRGAFFGS